MMFRNDCDVKLVVNVGGCDSSSQSGQSSSDDEYIMTALFHEFHLSERE
jgi:hypothetical protein